MTAWSDFYDHILPELNGIATPLVDHTLRQICMEFCEETSIHTTEVAAISVVANTSTYPLTSPVSGTEVFRVKNVWFNGRPLDIAPIDVLNGAQEYWPNTTATEPLAYTQKNPAEIILYPTPDTTLSSGLRVEVILRPADDSTGLTDWIAERYMRQLAAGVKARLMAQPDKPWTRPEFAMKYQAEYQAAKTRATIDANRSFTRGVLTVRPRPAVR